MSTFVLVFFFILIVAIAVLFYSGNASSIATGAGEAAETSVYDMSNSLEETGPQ